VNDTPETSAHVETEHEYGAPMSEPTSEAACVPRSFTSPPAADGAEDFKFAATANNNPYSKV
jgi:hypothetical protein